MGWTFVPECLLKNELVPEVRGFAVLLSMNSHFHLKTLGKIPYLLHANAEKVGEGIP